MSGQLTEYKIRVISAMKCEFTFLDVDVGYRIRGCYPNNGRECDVHVNGFGNNSFTKQIATIIHATS